MKLIIAGSRGIMDIRLIYTAVKEAGINIRDITEVVSGTARGVDQLGERFALENNIPIVKFPAKWQEQGRAAGYIRNSKMAEYADQLLALWDGESKGTKHMIDLMKKQKKPSHTYMNV